jgi:uncharacterized protein (TIGR03435 family)
LLLILFASAGRGQVLSQPSFEVASVKPGGELFSTRPQLSPGRFSWTTQLAYVIGYAYGLDFSRISGEGLGTVYTISAVCDPKTTEDELRLMLQSLLRDRFNLRSHRVVKQVDGSALSIAKNGIKMKEAVPGDEPVRRNLVSATVPSTGVVAITGRAASISQLVETLARVIGSPLWDKTGLEGKYDFAFRFAQDLSTDPPPGVPSLSTVLNENLGLVIAKQRGSLETLVVDHLDPPSAN